MFDDIACSIGFDLSGSQRHEGRCLHVHGGERRGKISVMVSYITGT